MIGYRKEREGFITIIVWDGNILAADRCGTNQGYTFSITKIRKINGNLVGVSGYGYGIPILMDWLEQGADVSKWPDLQKDKERWCDMIVITPERKILKYEQEPVAFEIEEKRHAFGSGRDYALAAMEMGADAIRAVEIASKFDSACGNGVDILSFDPNWSHYHRK